MRVGYGAWRRVGLATAIVVMSALFAVAGRAESGYPQRPVRIILPYGPGGVADVTTRLIAQKLSERMGQNFFVDNRPGAGGIVAAKAALSFPADGYTLFLTGNGAAISESLFQALPYNVEHDFASISIFAKFDILLATKADAKLDTVAKLVAFAKDNPGKLNFGAIAIGSTQDLSAELFRMVTGINAAIVTFRTTPELVSAIVRGDVDVGFDYYAAFNPMVAGKQIKVVAVSGDEPDAALPGVPTVKSSGYPDYVVNSWNSLSAPAGIPNEVIMKLNGGIRDALQLPDVRATMATLGMEPWASTPDELSQRMKADAERWRQVIEKAGIPKQ